MRRIAAITQAVAFIVTGVLVLFAFGLLATRSGGPRQAIPELILLAVALVAFLLASKPYVDADAASPAEPVEVQLAQAQVDLLALVVDSIVERTTEPSMVGPIPPHLQGIDFEHVNGRDVVMPVVKPGRNGAKHRAVN